MKRLLSLLAGILCCLLVHPFTFAQPISIEVDRYASAGDGSVANPWISESGCGGIFEAFQKLPDRGGVLHMRAGHYKIAKPCKLEGKSFEFRGDGLGKVIIDASSLPLSAPALTIEGALKPLSITAEQTRRGSTTFSVREALGIAEGDWLLIRSASELWNKARPYYFKGEWQQVKAASGTRITTALPIWDDYKSDTPVSRLEPIKMEISGFTMIGNPDPENGMQCLILQYAIDSSIHNTETKDCNERAWAMYYTVNSSFHHNVGQEHYPKKPQGLNYGLVVAMSYNIDAYENRIISGRHAISIGAVGGGGVNREIKVHDNALQGGEMMALDAHGIAEYFYYDHNQITGGADFGGEHGYFRGNTVTHGTAPYLLSLGEIRSWNFEISNNTFILDSPQTFGYGSIVEIQPSQDGRGKFVFTNNSFRVPARSSITTPQTVYIAVPGGDTIDLLDFSGNQFIAEKPAASTDCYILKIQSLGTGKIKSLRFVNNRLTGFSADLSGIEDADVELNTVDQAPNYGLRLGSVANAKLIKNTVSFSKHSGLLIDAPKTAGTILADGNIVFNNGQDSTARDIDRSGFSKRGPGQTTVILRNNSFYDNQEHATQQYGVFVYADEGADTVHEFNNAYSGNAIKPSISDARTKWHWTSQ